VCRTSCSRMRGTPALSTRRLNRAVIVSGWSGRPRYTSGGLVPYYHYNVIKADKYTVVNGMEPHKNTGDVRWKDSLDRFVDAPYYLPYGPDLRYCSEGGQTGTWSAGASILGFTPEVVSTKSTTRRVCTHFGHGTSRKHWVFGWQDLRYPDSKVKGFYSW
jgi:hypothetical protein